MVIIGWVVSAGISLSDLGVIQDERLQDVAHTHAKFIFLEVCDQKVVKGSASSKSVDLKRLTKLDPDYVRREVRI